MSKNIQLSLGRFNNGLKYPFLWHLALFFTIFVLECDDYLFNIINMRKEDYEAPKTQS